nr:hypothetical protein [uncultured Eisenbergiella sp.]
MDKKPIHAVVRTAVSGFPYGRHGLCGEKDPGQGSCCAGHSDAPKAADGTGGAVPSAWSHFHGAEKIRVPDLFPRWARAGHKGSRRRQYVGGMDWLFYRMW